MSTYNIYIKKKSSGLNGDLERKKKTFQTTYHSSKKFQDLQGDQFTNLNI